LCYFTMFIGMGGQTPGKMLLGLKVVRTDGEAVGFGRALVRWLGQCLSLLLLGLGFLMVAFSGRKQGLHDKIAGTYVIRHPF
ncbi:MAG TPA: RDD family protein, partial [Anaeromyxobacteraceae bacterium]|nr:RDD family protein [Anaeromyxobacteraceae bacterium]